MATRGRSLVAVFIYQGQQEFRIFVNLTAPEQCRNINKKLSIFQFGLFLGIIFNVLFV
jgi:hypothetical protein